MLEKLKHKAAKYARGFRGLYHSRLNPFEDLPLDLERILVGETVEEREIYAYRFGRGAQVRVLFIAGLYGDEIAAVKLMHKFVNFLHGRSPFVGVDVYVLPCLNLDGLALTLEDGNGRLNARGVDLGRNFAVPSFESENQWYQDGAYRRVFCGNEPFSEPETRGLRDFVAAEKIDVIYSFRSGSAVCGSNDRLGQELTKDFAKKSGYRYVNDEEWLKDHLTGTMKEWCEAVGRSYVEVEGGGRWEDLRDAIISAIKYHYG